MQTTQKSTLHKFISLLSAAVLMFGCVCHTGAAEKASAYENSDFSDEYGDFLYALGAKESSNNYSALSSNGQYFGRWQVGMLVLQEVGFTDFSGNWTSLAASYGATSRDTFLASPAAQDYAVFASHKKILDYAENMGVTKYIGTNVGGVEMTFAGMIVAAHALGIGGLQSLIQNGTSGNSGNDAAAVEYMKVCGIYDIENTIRNGTLPAPPGAETTTTTTSTTTTTTTSTTTTTATDAAVTTTVSTTEIPQITETSAAPEIPEYISVKPSSDVITAGKMVEIYVESDSAERYHILVSAPDGTETEYMLSGSSIGIILKQEGLHTITVTGYNSAGVAYAEPVYVIVQKETIVNEDNIGDANADGIVNVQDTTLILNYYACIATGTPFKINGVFNKYYADVNEDGVVNMTDASLVLSYYSKRSAGLAVKWSDIIPAA